jgi:type II secretory pathway pseudopilin PulG
MKGSRGFSVVEVLVATAIMLTVTGAVFQLLAGAVNRSAVWNDDADLHQRARVAMEAISAELRAAGAGGEHGPLRNQFLVVEPRRPGGVVTASAITVRYVPEGGELSDLVEAAWYFDPTGGVIRRAEIGHGDFPVVDGVQDLTFEYFDAFGSLPLDADPLRIRRVRVTVALRSRLARPMTFAFEVSPWNLDL